MHIHYFSVQQPASLYPNLTTPMPDNSFNKGVILDLDSLHPQDLELDALYATVPDWAIYSQTAPEQVRQRLEGCDLIIANKCPLDAETLAVSQLRLICVAATGTNNVDLETARRLGIAVCNVTGYATPSVAEHSFGLILALVRRLREHLDAAVSRWPQADQFCVLDYPVMELSGRTLGIVGYGELGHAVARIAAAFGMRTLISQRPGTEDNRPGRVRLSDLLERSDVVSLHCPLTPQTRNLIDAGALARMQPHALLINTARGGIVDEAALLAALESGRIGGAALDVLSTEPPAADHPLLRAELPNLLITPHVAWASREARQRLVDELRANIEAYRAGGNRNSVV